MGHSRDRWTDPKPVGNGRVKNDRWGKGKRWQARWVQDGRDRAAACATKDEADATWQRGEAGLIASSGTTAPTGITLNAYCDVWLASQLGHRANTVASATTRIRVRIRPALGIKTLAEITRRDVQDAVVEWSSSCAPQTVRGTYGLLSQILKSALHDRLITETPCVTIKLPKLAPKRVIPMTRDQVDAMETAMAPYLSSMVVVGAALGMRLGELRGLTVDHIKRGSAIVDRQLNLSGVGWGPVKTSAGDRTIHLGEVATRAIREHLATYGEGPGGLIWRNSKGLPLQAAVAVHAWEKARKQVPGLRPRSGWHDLRHYNASLLIAAGLSVRAVADRLGHDDPSITLRIYSHLWPSDQAAASAAIDAALG